VKQVKNKEYKSIPWFLHITSFFFIAREKYQMKKQQKSNKNEKPIEPGMYNLKHIICRYSPTDGPWH
jgi:hypothetical protein